jgi:hypothetical protein
MILQNVKNEKTKSKEMCGFRAPLAVSGAPFPARPLPPGAGQKPSGGFFREK